jgi:hypothetical protein
MLRETILQLSKAAEARKPALLIKIASQPDYVSNPDMVAKPNPEPNPPTIDVSQEPAPGTDYLQMGKDYGPAVGYGAAGGAIAGIPIALLSRALFSNDEEDADLPSYLMTALKGGLIGGGLGGLAGGGARALYQNSEGTRGLMNRGIDSVRDYGAMGTAAELNRIFGRRN